MTKKEKISAIIDAAANNKFTDKANDIDCIDYKDDDGKICTDLIDYISNGKVYFIAGTGYPNFNVPLNRLTTKSINAIYNCIAKEN